MAPGVGHVGRMREDRRGCQDREDRPECGKEAVTCQQATQGGPSSNEHWAMGIEVVPLRVAAMRVAKTHPVLVAAVATTGPLLLRVGGGGGGARHSWRTISNR